MKQILEVASAIFAGIAAILWLKSAKVRTPSQFPINVISTQTTAQQIIGEQVVSVGSSQELDALGRAVIDQSKWSAWAAGSAATAAICQAIAAIMK